jgi:hypothetical protein
VGGALALQAASSATGARTRSSAPFRPSLIFSGYFGSFLGVVFGLASLTSPPSDDSSLILSAEFLEQSMTPRIPVTKPLFSSFQLFTAGKARREKNSKKLVNFQGTAGDFEF